MTNLREQRGGSVVASASCDWLLNSPIIRLFVIIALGYLVGEIKFPGGFRLGVAGVLFVGLACGVWSPSMELPAEVQTLGLGLFGVVGDDGVIISTTSKTFSTRRPSTLSRTFAKRSCKRA